MKKLTQPTRSFLTLKISWKTSPGWLQLVFHFGTEDWADQLKKTPCIIFWQAWWWQMGCLGLSLTSWRLVPFVEVACQSYLSQFYTVFTEICQSFTSLCHEQTPATGDLSSRREWMRTNLFRNQMKIILCSYKRKHIHPMQQCNYFGHYNVARDIIYPFLHISSKKISCTKSWCKSDVDPARIRCCHQHRLSNKTYSAIPEQRTTRQLCFHWRTSQPLKQTGGSHSNEPDQDESANWHFLSFSELPVETYHHPKI